MPAAVVMLVFLLSLAGIPPTAGFIGKYYLFTAAMKAGYAWLAVLAVLMSAVSLFYYFRIAAAMFFSEAARRRSSQSSYALTAVVAICAAGTLVVGIAPEPFLAVLSACVLAPTEPGARPGRTPRRRLASPRARRRGCCSCSARAAGYFLGKWLGGAASVRAACRAWIGAALGLAAAFVHLVRLTGAGLDE